MDFEGTERFEIQRRLGEGGMGVVYQALDRERNDHVALKTLRRVDPQSLYRLKREFRTLQDLDHPNLVRLGELIEAEGQWFFTMELVDGCSFLDWVRTIPVELDPELEETAAEMPRSRNAKAGARRAARADRQIGYDEARLRRALAELATGLDALHEADKVHRDVKPSNVLVAEDGRVVLLDFGLVTERAADVSADAQVVGTAAYMAPEQAASKTVGPGADWYSVGVLLYEALTGRLPFVGSPLQILMDKQSSEPPPPRELVADIPEDLDRLCARLLRFEPDQRPSGAEVLHRLGVAKEMPALLSTSHGSSARLFVGRESELAQLRAAFETSQQQHAVAVRVQGESGLGKSALIRRFLQMLSEERKDAVVLSGRCYEREQVPYKALDGVIDALSRHLRRLDESAVNELLPRHAASLPKLFPVLGMVEAIAQWPRGGRFDQDPVQARARAFGALRELITRLADRHPVVMVIDDLQWADADSRVLLTDLLRPPETPPLLLLVTTRARPEDRYLEALPREQVHHLELQPLSPEASSTLTTALLTRAGIAPSRASALISVDALGHPLFIDELVRHAATVGDLDPDLRLDDAIWHRVSSLPEDARQILELVSLAGAPLRFDTYARASQLNASDFGRRLSMLRAANLVRRTSSGAERFEPYHNRVREAVASHVGDEEAREHHHRLAVALGSAAPGTVRPELMLHHLQHSGQPGKAAEFAELAAQEAMLALAFDRAAQLFATALRMGDGDAERDRRLRLGMAEALTNAGRGVEAATAYLEAADGADPVTRRECQRLGAQQLLITGHIEEGERTLGALLNETNVTLPTTRRQALFGLVRERIKLRLRGMGFTTRHEREVSGAELARLDVFRVVATGLAMVDNIRGALFQTRSLRHALNLGEPRRIAHALGMESVFVGSQGGRALGRARRMVDRIVEMADEDNDPLLRAYALAGEGVWWYLCGKFGRAVEFLGQAERTLRNRTVGTQMELNNVRLFHLFCLRHLGAMSECAQRFDVYVRDAERRGDLYAETTFRRSCSRTWLARDRPDTARFDLERTSWTAPEDGFHFQHWYDLEARAELALYEGDVPARYDQLRPQYDALGRSLLFRIQIVRTAAYWMWGRFLLALSERPEHRAEAIAAATRLARKLCREKIEYANAWGQMLMAGLHSSRGDSEQARSALRRAIVSGDECSMSVVTEVSRWGLGQLIGGDEGAELAAAARQWMEAEGVVSPERFVRAMLPMPGSQ